jgi:hypothetical protein
MPAGQAEEIIALALVFAVHVVGGVLLVWALLDDDQRSGWRRRWGRGRPDDPPMPPPPPDAGTGVRPPLPLPGATPSAVRLRGPLRLADRYQRPARRPARPAAPTPRRSPTPERRRRA